MWTRGKDKEQPGKFAYELWDERRLLHRSGGYASVAEADRAAERAQRNFLHYGIAEAPLPDDGLTPDELMAALSGE